MSRPSSPSKEATAGPMATTAATTPPVVDATLSSPAALRQNSRSTLAEMSPPKAGAAPGAWLSAWLSASPNAQPNYAATTWRSWHSEGGGRDSHGSGNGGSGGRRHSRSEWCASRGSSASPSPLGMRSSPLARSGSGGDLFATSEAGSWISAKSKASDVETMRRAKHEERQAAREAESARVNAENTKNERRKSETGACAVVRLSPEIEAKRAAKVAESAADKEAQFRRLKAENAQMKRRLEAAGAAVDHTPMFSKEAMDLSKPPPRHMLKSATLRQPEWHGAHSFSG